MLKTITATGVATIMFDGDIVEASTESYAAEFDFAADTFTGTITEPDGTVNNLIGYHGTGQLPPLGGVPCTTPPPSGVDVTLSGLVDFPDGMEIPEGEVWEIDGNVDTTIRIHRRAVVRGRLVRHETGAATTRIVMYGINNADYIGGHMGGLTDDGFWVTGNGQLDISGTPKQAWNRTGWHDSWSATDEVKLVPLGVADVPWAPSSRPDHSIWKDCKAPVAEQPVPNHGYVKAAPTWPKLPDYVAGQAIPEISTGGEGTTMQTAPVVVHTFRAEVLNLTRNVIFDTEDSTGHTGIGHAHLQFLHCSKRQSLRFVEVRNFGPDLPVDLGDGTHSMSGVLGRYPVHFHYCGDGVDGSIVKGVVVRDSFNHGFVPHESHGVTFLDCIAYGTRGAAYWWDHNDNSHRVAYDRCVSIMAYHEDGFMMQAGKANRAVDCVAALGLGNSGSAGFGWNSIMNGEQGDWWMDGSISHNNGYHGIRTWNNERLPRTVGGMVAFRNEYFGLSAGAYVMFYRFHRNIVFGNGVGDWDIHALGEWEMLDNWIERLNISNHRLDGQSTQTQKIITNREWKIGHITVNELVAGFGSRDMVFESGHTSTRILPEDVTVVGPLGSRISFWNVKVEVDGDVTYPMSTPGNWQLIP